MFLAYIKTEVENNSVQGITFNAERKLGYRGRLVSLEQSSKGSEWFLIRNSNLLYHISWLECIRDTDHGYGVVRFEGYNRIALYDGEHYIDAETDNLIMEPIFDTDFNPDEISSTYSNSRSRITCNICGGSFHRSCVDETGLCYKCSTKTTVKCSFCNKKVDPSDVRKVDGQNICSDCSHFIFKCCKCGTETTQGINIGEDEYCSSCYSKELKNVDRCKSCGSSFLKSEHALKSGYCDVCNLQRRLNNSKIYNYTFKPEPIFYGDGYADPLFLGVELEITTRNLRNELARYLQFDVNKDGDFCYCKFDRSIGMDGNGGFEIVTHPFNRQWLKSDVGLSTIHKILELRKYGCKSFDTNTCGMHVHMSKNSFSETHLYKFLYMIFNNKDFIVKISDRIDMKKVDRYCSFEPERPIIDLAKTRINGTGDLRHKAVNLSNDSTVEVRIFRGTLNFERFMKNIDFCVSMYEFTKDCSIKDLDVEKYKQYVVSNKGTYKNLCDFLAKYKEI